MLQANGVPNDVIDSFTGDDEQDFYRLMDFFCNRWPGKTGNLRGCRVGVLPGNIEAYRVFNIVSGSWNYHPSGRPIGIHLSEIESAMEFVGVRHKEDCFSRVQFLISKILQGMKG
jgi:hypothetical protein